MPLTPKYDKLLGAVRESDLPSQAGSSGKYLTTDGTSASWATVSGGSSIGSTIGGASPKEILFTDASSKLSQDATLTFDPVTKSLGAQTAIFTEANGRQEVINTALSAPATDIDPGAFQNNNLAGYTSSYITNKTLYNVAVGGNNSTPVSGSIRQSLNTLQAYLNGVWNTIVTGFRFREDASAGYVLEHQPVGFSDWLELDTGNSIENRGLNGLPIVQQYMVTPGAFPYPLIDSGGTV